MLRFRDAVFEVGLHRGRNVLHQRAASSDVQHLHPPADREHRNVARDRLARQRNLERVAVAIGHRRRMRRLTIQRRVHVRAATQEKPVDAIERLLRIVVRFEHQGFATRALHGFDVVIELRTARDADHGFHRLYILSGTVQPIRSRARVIRSR
jgi:hypothetical protein